MNYKEFSAKVKAKYPEYGDMDDLDLAQKMVAKFPKEYSDVSFDTDPMALNEAPGVERRSLDTIMPDLAGAMIGRFMPDGMRQVAQQAQSEIKAGRTLAKGFGAAGKAVTDATAELSPTLSKVPEFVLPQDELGAYATIAGPAIGGMAANAALKMRPAAQLITREVAPLGQALSSGAKNLIRYAESKGLKFSAAELADHRLVTLAENLLEKTPLGSDSFDKFRRKQIDAIRGMRDRLSEKLGTREDAEVLDEIAKKAVAEVSKQTRDQSDALYAQLGARVAGKEIPLPGTTNAAIDLLEKEMAKRPELRNQGIIKMAADVLGIEPQNLNADTLPFIREQAEQFLVDWPNFTGTQRYLGNIIDQEDAARALGAPGVKFLSSEEAGAAKLLFKNTEIDLSKYSSARGGDLKKAHDAVKQFYREGRAVFNDRAVKQMLRTDPGKVVDTVFKPGAVIPIRAVKRALGGDKTGFTALKKQFVEKILPEVGDNFNPTEFQKLLDKYGEPTLREIFSKEELMQFKGLAKVSARAQEAARLQGTQGSARINTALASGGVAGGMIMANPLLGIPGAVGVVLGPKALAELYLSDAGRKMLMEGFTVKVGTPQAAKLAAQVTGFLGAKGVLPKQEDEKP